MDNLIWNYEGVKHLQDRAYEMGRQHEAERQRVKGNMGGKESVVGNILALLGIFLLVGLVMMI